MAIPPKARAEASLRALTQRQLRPLDDAGDAHAAASADGDHPVP
jgi:hypothetical protein